MANREFNQFRCALEKRVIDLFASVKFGASGAPTATINKGITSVAQGAVGMYLFKLMDSYNRLVQADYTSMNSATYVAGSAQMGGGTPIALPAAPELFSLVPSEKLAGGAGIINIQSAIAGNVVTIAGVAFTAITNGSVPSGDQWDVGSGGTADADSCKALAAAINAAVDAAVVAAGIKAYAFTTTTSGASSVIITATKPTTLAKTGAPITITPSSGVMSSPCLVIQMYSGAGAPANPASGEEGRFDFTFSDSTAL